MASSPLALFDLLDLLVRLALASSGAIMLVLLARAPLRRFAGAANGYLCWLAVPAALLAAALPAFAVAPVAMLAFAPTLKASALVASVAPATLGTLDWLARAWVGGVVATALLFLFGQRAFVRSLGTFTGRDGVFYAANSRHGPALLGLFRPVIVVPADFARRYSADEQALIIAHEQQHASRRDPAANAALAELQCAFWFNPLMHIAASRFRFDQELACDADVMARHGEQRQSYAAAMLKTQVTGAAALATCHWQSSHPLKERIMHLQHTLTNSRRRRSGRLIAALIACASVLGTVSARTGSADAYDIAVQFAEGAGNTSAKVRVKAGEDFALRWDQAGQSWKGVFNVTSAPGEAVMVKMKVTEESGKVITPALLLRLGQAGSARDGEAPKPAFQIGLTVTRAAGG